MINEYGAAGGMRIDRGNRSKRRTPAPIPFINHKSHKTWPVIEPDRGDVKPAIVT
jgi:hypothetical protein